MVSIATTIDYGSASTNLSKRTASCGSCAARPISVCNSISDHDIGRLMAVATDVDVDANRTFIEEGEAAQFFFNITGGTARLFKLLADGRRQVTGFARRGHFLGLAVDDAYTFSAEAIEPVRLCRFPRAKVYALIDDFPTLRRRLLETASNELVVAQEQMLLLGRKTARERLASFLVSQAVPPEVCGGASDRIHLPMSRTDIADYLGLTIETVRRVITKLNHDRLIAPPTTTDVVILDRDTLVLLADGAL